MYTNREEMVSETDVIPLGLIYIVRKGKKNKLRSTFIKARTYRNFNETAFDNDLARADWSGIYYADTVDNAWSVFKSIFLQVANKHATFVNMKVKEDSPPYFNANLRSLCVDRHYFMHKAHKSKKAEDFHIAKQLRNLANNLLNSLKTKFFDDQISEDRYNPKGLWITLKKIIPTKGDRGIIHEINAESGEIVSDSKRIANTINRFFANIGKVLAYNITPSQDFNQPEIKPPENPFTMKLINVDFVKKEHITKSTGKDTIPSRLLKASVSTTCRALTHNFKRSLTSANVHKEWKTARVTPIFKDGDRTEVGNYKPISILRVVMKILERAIHSQLYSYRTENNLLSPVQSGFHKTYSTLTTLIDISDCIL